MHTQRAACRRSAGGDQVAESLQPIPASHLANEPGEGSLADAWLASISMNCGRGMSCAPRLSRCGVAIWQSIM